MVKNEVVEKKKGPGLLRTIGIVILGLVVALVAVVATRPAAFHIERSVLVQAPPENVFVHVDDFHAWGAWSPWEKLDPKMERVYSGAPSGVGARYGWKSESDEVGEGKMEIEKSEKPWQIVIRLEFIKPFAATNTATFAFVPSSSGTQVTWAMDGNNGFMGKAASLVMDMDQLVGSDFERGLAALKTLAESAAKPATQTATVGQ
jgi:polyketide cyclase/dehydrase/lipid transport protein